MKNNIFTKMILIFSIPALGMIFYSALYSYNKYTAIKKINSITSSIEYVRIAEKLLTSIQKERGISAAFLASKGIVFNNKLILQRKKTDKLTSTYLAFINNNNFFNKISRTYIKEVQNKLFYINNLRDKISNQNIKLKEELNKYNKLTNALITSMSKILITEDTNLFNKKMYSIINIIIAKEYAGLERAMLSNSFSKNGISSHAEYNEIIKLIAFQRSNLKKFKDSINIEEFNFFNQSVNLSIVNSVESYRKIFFKSYDQNTYSDNIKSWWDISTVRINALGKNISYFMKNILKESTLEKETMYTKFTYSLIFFIISLISLIISIVMLRKLTKTEQKNFFSLNKLKQIYNILSNTNELIIYDYKMKEVLEQTCILATKELDLSLTFICMINENKNLLIIEHAKKENINIDNIDTNKINSIYKKSFFEKQTIIIDNINTYISSHDFKIEKQNGIKSIAVCPLYKKDDVVGVLTFCSQIDSFFDKQIIDIFNKMANDLSYGIEKEERANIRKNYEEELIIASYAFDSQEAMAITDLNAKIIRVNNSFTTITGYTHNEVIGKNPNILKSGKHNELFYKKMWKDLMEKDFWSGELYNKRKNGEIYPERTTIRAIKNDKNETTNFIAQFIDITEMKKNQEKLIYDVQHDSLTGLYNRIILEERLKQSIIAANRHNHFGAILFLDLDNFKYINDSFGHNIGDKLLKTIANILKKISRKDDLLVRLGGDEFIVLIHNLGKNKQQAVIDIEHFAHKIRTALDKIIDVENYKLTCTSSIGISLFPEFNNSYEEIIKNADTAMYLAKEKGKNQIMFYHDDLDSQSKNYLKIENELRTAIQNDEFELYYQAKYDNKIKKIIGFEALIRWNHPVKGLVYPDEFISIAEQSGLIVNIGKFVLNDSCKQINKWLKDGINLEGLRLSINISSLELEQVNFIDSLKESIKENNIPGKYLDIEITESIMLKNIDLAIRKLEEIQKLGISISMDDFGVGFSSLNYISNLPVNTIKLDKNFIMKKDLPVNEAIIDMVIKISKTLNLNLVIEGVENLEDIIYLENKNTYIYQGFHISRPIKDSKAIQLLKNDFKL